MGKRRKLAHNAQQPRKHGKPGGGGGGVGKGKGKEPTTGNKAGGAYSSKPQKQKQTQTQKQHSEPVIPFSPEDRILLIGDGDLSFGASLIEHHCCADVTATVLEKGREELLEKYPHAAENIAKIEEAEGDGEGEGEGSSASGRVLYGVDATTMRPFADKRTGTGLMDRIIFNFPHVGGKSTDVNRQVRYNQELLVAFFGRAAPSLAPGGSIIVTLFEGEPYTLWNVRDLARHSGLRVDRSFVFRPVAYPGYRHARTLGAVRNRQTGEIGGGWRGEDRPARSYVFVRKDDDPAAGAGSGDPASAKKSKKRARTQDSDSSDDE